MGKHTWKQVLNKHGLITLADNASIENWSLLPPFPSFSVKQLHWNITLQIY